MLMGNKTMNYSSLNFQEKLAKFSDQWSPRVIAEMNDYQFKLVKVQGDFVWHDHPDTDEVFMGAPWTNDYRISRRCCGPICG